MTDNLLINLLYLFCNAFRIYTLSAFMSLFFKRKKGFGHKEFLAYLGFFLVNSAAFLIWRNPVVNVLNNILILFLVTFLYPSKFFMRILATAIIFASNMMIENVVTALLFDFAPSMFESAITVVISCLVLYAVVLIIRNNLDLREDGTAPTFQTLMITLVSSSSIFLALGMAVPELRINHTFITVGLILLLLMNFLIIYLYDSAKNKARQEQEALLLQQQNKFYMKQYDAMFKSQEGIRLLRHDMKGHMSAIKALLEQNEPIKATTYIEEVYQTLSSSRNRVESGNAVVDCILSSKVQEADQLGILIDYRIKVPPELNIAPFDLGAILINLMDNAINAVKNLDSPSTNAIFLSLSYECGVLYITLQNQYSGELAYNNGRITTTHIDSKNHGYGLWSVQKAAEKYSGAVEIKSQNNCFIVDVLLYDTKENC